MKDLKGKIVWITGASSGIGEALAYAFAQEGSFLVLSARNIEKLSEVKNKCLELTPKCWIQPLNLLKTEELPDAVNSVIKETGKIDLLINNAGRSQRSLAVETPLEIDRELMETNFFGTVALTKLVLQNMKANQSGHIVAISSIVGKFGFPMRTAYSASKHAVQGFFEALRTELINDNIKITIVSPGRINTNISLNAVTANGTAYSIMDDGQSKGMTAPKCAKRIIAAIKKGRKDVLVGNKELIMVYIRRFFPPLFYKLVTGIKN